MKQKETHVELIVSLDFTTTFAAPEVEIDKRYFSRPNGGTFAMKHNCS